ncbi:MULTISPECIES: Na+/H+ antiporter subunit E [unclassified Halomonas]|uniref:Na+/H+ antiporter subunit E n=1 Tax=unclassified Halomonas TaxID=2609666 RepID=UPI0020A14AEC|nr:MULTISPECIES: Na+/H+ antiporter subunit E [unclassified Halomonas]MCP1313963.1 Na+/H+ antiporter subunit E [Halomonas sp. 707D7]MCP1325164.1 Na+/H+ antiporter subunit E [Halomonas sp. 707D4]
MTRWLPSPVLSVALLVMWLLLSQSIAPAQLLLGAAIALAAPLLARPLRPLAPAPFRKPWVLARLLFMSMVEIVRSCFNVSRIILFKSRGVESQFIRIPLDLKDPHGLALLSCLINSTPGTVWVEQLPGSNDLALHVFDLHDEQWWIDTIKTRYEQPLIEIFDHE